MLKFFNLLSVWGILPSCQTPKEQSQQAAAFAGPKFEDDYSDIIEIQHYKKWGTYNVHDPAAIKAGNPFYTYSTDAIWWPEGAVRESDSIRAGNIHVRRSKDLVNWIAKNGFSIWGKKTTKEIE